ncbi:PREDICTED: uncharacterized protein LOC107338024 [Acropora digitifera]|uniref:uncharacterized protein LOC107338024 n=1 Tax=Acropora digitifera TaxID=70779 RepID=UPI00077B11B9|nr:PREDICTED: uncharacterized protein LOC107338024 [Acropora digitifera]
MPTKLANLWVTLHSDALTQETTVLVTGNVIIKVPKEIFYGKSTEISQKEKPSDQRKEIVDQLLAIRDSCNSRSFEQNTERASSRSCCVTGLASPRLISQSSGDAETGTNLPQSTKGPTPVTRPSRGSTLNVLQTEPPSLSLIRESLAKYNLSSSAKDLLMASWREGTSKQYHTYLKRWRQCYDDKDIALFQPGVHNGVEFLVSLNKAGLGYSAVNTARSALSSLLILENNKSLEIIPWLFAS